MAASKERVFDDKPAVRGPTPLLFGLIGPSGSGKTFSALRLATGIQRVTGGEIYLIDTEANRALHYAERFAFRHVPFKAPFSPLDYLDAIRHCERKGARIVIVDSMSHEHEGPGGVLEWHSREVTRIAAAWKTSEDKANIPAWNEPKQARRLLINSILQTTINFLFCYRAKEKVRPGGGKVEQLGWMPIAGEEFVYELAGKALLMPGANGVPTWNPQHDGEKMMVKLPEQFRSIFTGQAAKQLDEDTGEQLARWAAGSSNPFADEYAACTTQQAFDALEARRRDAWPKLKAQEKAVIKAASDAAGARIRSSSAGPAFSGDLLEPAVIAVLEEAFKQGRAALATEWANIQNAYATAQKPIPLAVDAKYGELNESLKE